MKATDTLGLKWNQHGLWILDQTKLPHESVWIHCEKLEHIIECIKSLRVRGAPLIGVSAALFLGVLAKRGAGVLELEDAAENLKAARPTAVNLAWAVDKVMKKKNNDLLASEVFFRAEEILFDDINMADGMASFGSPLINDGDQILTHCNTGGLATAGIGTALGVILRAHDQGKKIHVYVDETRPLLQGARLTTWELEQRGVPYTLICDNMAAFLMQQKKISKVFVGADRISANWDFANKIGTYGLAVLSHFHKIPFYVVAPQSTRDLRSKSMDQIIIENREPEEVRQGRAPRNCSVYNPAFDLTPAGLVTAFVLNDGIVDPKQIGFSV